ncbi:hypothetical protein GCM10007359_12390 [Rothia aerolata]|uniref:Uncharacterized protein n=1 Tax=Rothia aerolata TaxID=1812262 RepID=A0A917MT92_9MICC|nr:hypothetical protein GCM10007359_12390 [Rothia aerolata]
MLRFVQQAQGQHEGAGQPPLNARFAIPFAPECSQARTRLTSSRCQLAGPLMLSACAVTFE